MLAKKQMLILGGTGFIGSKMVEQITFLNKDYEIVLLIRDKARRREFELKGFKVLIGDFTKLSWEKTGLKPDIVYHFARNSSTYKSFGRWFSARKGKKGNKKLLHFLERNNKLCRLYYLSGSLMYGNSRQLLNEDNKLNPISFAKEYIEAEMPFVAYKSNALQVTLVRVPWVIGPGSWYKAFYLDRMANNKEVPLYGSGENKMSFINRESITNFMIKDLELSFKPIVNLTFSIVLQQREFAELLADKYKLKIREIELNNFENAIQEAFQSNILLGSKYDLSGYFMDIRSKMAFQKLI